METPELSDMSCLAEQSLGRQGFAQLHESNAEDGSMGNNKRQTRLTHEEEYSYSRRLKEMKTLNNSNKAARQRNGMSHRTYTRTRRGQGR
jgi:hypothetical protein